MLATTRERLSDGHRTSKSRRVYASIRGSQCLARRSPEVTVAARRFPPGGAPPHAAGMLLGLGLPEPTPARPSKASGAAYSHLQGAQGGQTPIPAPSQDFGLACSPYAPAVQSRAWQARPRDLAPLQPCRCGAPRRRLPPGCRRRPAAAAAAGCRSTVPRAPWHGAASAHVLAALHALPTGASAAAVSPRWCRGRRRCRRPSPCRSPTLALLPTPRMQPRSQGKGPCLPGRCAGPAVAVRGSADSWATEAKRGAPSPAAPTHPRSLEPPRITN